VGLRARVFQGWTVDGGVDLGLRSDSGSRRDARDAYN
jgi:hypothetical protein